MMSRKAGGGFRLFRMVALSSALAFALGVTTMPAHAAVTPPVLWTAGGLDAGSTGAGQGARITSDSAGNVAVVSGPAKATALAVTSYSPTGALRWRKTIKPSSGTYKGDWVVAAPNGDFVAVGTAVTTSGDPFMITIVRYASDGTRLWRKNISGTFPSVGRLVVDSAGNAYLAYNSMGDGQDTRLRKYSPTGARLWSATIATGSFANDIATSLALSPDQTRIVVTGDISGGATWTTAAYDTASGARKWLVTAGIGTAARDVVVDASRAYVAGQGSYGIETYLTVVAYDLATGAQVWRTDNRPATNYAGTSGLRIAQAPYGRLVVAGQTGQMLDWWVVALNTRGGVLWTVRRDERSDWDEIPAVIFVLPSGDAVVSGPGGPPLPGGYVQGATVGYGADGSLKWEAFSRLATTWATPLPSGDVCATGGYDALVTCWDIA